MKERPILFSGEMVRAILDGRKTQTRRVVKPIPKGGPDSEMVDLGRGGYGLLDGGLSGPANGWRCHYGKPGDRLWVRETFSMGYSLQVDSDSPYFARHIPVPIYRADEPKSYERIKWKPSIHMPRLVSRINLEVTGIRVDRVQDITTEDQIAEGLQTNLREYDAVVDLRDQWVDLWDRINGKTYPWASNPWVWVVEFKRI